MARAPRHAGFTLLEITIILAVMAVLGLILTPSVVNFINNSRLTRAQSDVQVLANAVADFYEDNGFFPKYNDPAKTQEIALLVTPGAVPDSGQGTATERWTVEDASLVDLLSNQLVNNRPGGGNVGYPLKVGIGATGWAGPYISSTVSEDPWGNRYAINVEFLEPMPGATEPDGQEKRAVWAMSAGPDAIVNTVYPTQSVQVISLASLAADDIGIRLQ